MTGLQHINRGMRVVDSLGRAVGTVDLVHPGDGAPVTTHGRGGLPTGLARALTSAPNVHPQTAARMLRTGYVTIRCRRVLSRRGYAAADQIRDVHGDVVRLAVTREELLSG